MVEVDPADGCFPLPAGPGLGVTLNEAFVAEHPPKEAFFDLFAENWHRRQAGAQTTTGAARGGTTPSSGGEAHNGHMNTRENCYDHSNHPAHAPIPLA